MRSTLLLAAVAVVAVTIGSLGIGAPLSPYAGQQTREIKALSAQEIDDLLNGRGMALAKAAELNGYPGPLHIIEMAAELGLTADQLGGVRDIKARMAAAAIPIGTEIIAVERELDQLFVSGAVTNPSLDVLLTRLGGLQARLRSVHLAAISIPGHCSTPTKLPATTSCAAMGRATVRRGTIRREVMAASRFP